VPFARCAFAQIVVPAGAVVPDLGQGHGVQAAVELAVPGPGESVAHDVAGGDLDRRCAGVGGERCRRPEPGDVPDPGEDFPRGQIADAAQLGQGGGALGDGGADVGGGGGDTPVQVANLGDELGGQPAQRAWPARAGAHGAQQPRGSVGVELSWRAAGQQLGQQHV